MTGHNIVSYASLSLGKKLLAQIDFLNLLKSVSQASPFEKAKSQASIFTEPLWASSRKSN